ncbi:MAG: FAD-dependent oxidoreductase [Gloeomargarita sp. DG02_4_bins_56]
MRIAVIGAGVIGAAVAWELSTLPGADIHVWEARPSPAQGATGAALGLLMAVLSQRGAQKRLAGLQRYQQIQTQSDIPGNSRGILHLYYDLQSWQNALAKVRQRQKQGWAVASLTPAQVSQQFPRVNGSHLSGAIWCPQERQVQPIALTQNWLDLAAQQGVTIHYDSPIRQVSPGQPMQLELPDRPVAADWVIVCAGLGTTQIRGLIPPFRLEAVLGQAIEVGCPELANYPILYGDDTAIVPQDSGQVWVGATVEFSPAEPPVPNPEFLQQLWQKAIHLCPILADKTWCRQWYGLRPRPVGQPAPIVQIDPQAKNVIWATGHYRNGVLLAPLTAAWVRQILQTSLG